MQSFQASFSSSDHIAFLDNLIDTTLSMAGISPASLGRGLNGPVSGTALRLRMYQSLSQAMVARESLQEGVSHLLRSAALLDTANYGAKRAVSWTDAEGTPTVKLSEGLPTDQLELAQTASTMLTSGTASQETAIKLAQPNLSDEQVQEELAKIQDEQGAAINNAVSQAVGGVQPLTLDQLA